MKPIVVTHEAANGDEHSYRGWLVGHVIANHAWEGGGGGSAERPILMVVAASHGESGPLTAALSRGARAVVDTGRHDRNAERYELLKSAGFRRLTQAEPAGVLTTFYHPDLFRRDPGMVDPDEVALAILPRQSWVEAQRYDADAIAAHLAALGNDVGATQIDATWTPQARLFGEALDRRTRAPFPGDDRFLVQLLRVLVWRDFAVMSDNYGNRRQHKEVGLDKLGYARGLSFKASQKDIERVIAQEVACYFKTTEVLHGAA